MVNVSKFGLGYNFSTKFIFQVILGLTIFIRLGRLKMFAKDVLYRTKLVHI